MPEVTEVDRAALLEKARRRQRVRVAVVGPVIFAASLVGALLAPLVLGRLHDRQIARFESR